MSIKRLCIDFFCCQILALLFVSLAYADGQGFIFNVTVSVDVKENIVLAWQYPAKSKNVEIYRRSLGAVGVASWEKIASISSPEQTYTDISVKNGESLEYRVLSETGQTSFFCITKHAPLVDYHGGVLFVVDKTHVKHLKQELTLYEMDLAGDGWDVFRLDWERHDKYHPERAHELREAIQDQVKQHPQINSVILFGKLPVVKSGYLAPDGHNKRPHETDTYYADIDGEWTDEYLKIADVNIPGDDILDQRTYPSPLELAVGRITFHNMEKYHKTEEEYLKDYIHKVHAWRHGYRKVPLQGVLGDTNNGYYLFGSRNIFWTMFNGKIIFDFQSVYEQPYMWLGMIGKINQAQLYYRGIFCMNFKSYKQTFWTDNNPIRGLLAQPDWGLASMWGARPQFYLHHMAAGKPIGYSFLRTQNNGFNDIPEYYPQDYNSLNNVVSTNLQGDPTLRMHQILPASHVAITQEQNAIKIKWRKSPDTNVIGYHIYKSTDKLKGYKRLTENPINATEFSDQQLSGEKTTYYQVRAVGETDLPTGTYMNQSQGLFVSLTFDNSKDVEQNAAASLSVETNKRERFKFIENTSNQIFFPVIVENPQHGRLRFIDQRWYYQPQPGYSGNDTVRYIISDGVHFSDAKLLDIEVTPQPN